MATKTEFTTPRAQKGKGTTVSIDLKDHAELLQKIRAAAKEDDREVSNWLRRRVVEIHKSGNLITAPEDGTLFEKRSDGLYDKKGE